MTVREVLKNLYDNDFIVNHKLLGDTKMHMYHDLIRIRSIDYKYHYAKEVLNVETQCLDDEILDLEVEKIETWLLGVDPLAYDIITKK